MMVFLAPEIDATQIPKMQWMDAPTLQLIANATMDFHVPLTLASHPMKIPMTMDASTLLTTMYVMVEMTAIFHLALQMMKMLTKMVVCSMPTKIYATMDSHAPQTPAKLRDAYMNSITIDATMDSVAQKTFAIQLTKMLMKMDART